ncbi:Bug family tripartite tricarboxylate transporter substrate binding protein [Variovorax terrae]|uniref:Tripartite tricarboxylate transporter substrate binding protein n=1 Tax=Variovorax terrae TaxID=2923278 RepID=A0A9X1VYE4_9BURK|nr:tripartite tricarboxylate transporter substrate binding protein [Variovorax terrae]MCJ0765762.1 tripartite tricarboxylate transporter substrate binding protein [Variovorax terrae]
MTSTLLNRRQTLAMLAALGGAGASLADNAAFPLNKPIRIIAPSAGGGPTDAVARILAERLAPVFKVPVIVDNKPGAVGAIALDAAAKSPPDGHTLVVGFVSANIIHPLLNPKVPFDARKDFTPITQVMSGGVNLMAHPSLPANTLQEFIAYAKKQPQPMSYGSFGSGSTAHLAGEYLQTLTGIKMAHVPYKSATALVNDLVGGHVMVGFTDTTNAAAQIRTGRLKGIAQTGTVRAPSLKDVPTMQEQGVPFTAGAWNGIFGPAHMPPAVIERLNREIVQILKAPDLQDRWITAIGYPPVPTSSAEFAQIVKSDFDTWQKVITASKITLD